MATPTETPNTFAITASRSGVRQNKLAITVFDGYDDIVDKCCRAWNFFADDKSAITSITSRQWAQVNI